MRHASGPPDDDVAAGPAAAAGGGPLAGIDAVAASLHGAFEELLRLTIQAQTWGGTPGAAGCTVGDYLRLEAGLPAWLAGQLEAVARRLPALPAVAELFWAGVVTFDQLARVVRTTSGHNGALLAQLDTAAATLAGRLATEGRIHAWEHELDHLVEDLRAPGWRARQERRRELGQRLVAQQDFDGGGFIGEWLAPQGWATRMAAIDAETDPDAAAGNRRRARAEASVRIAELHLAGHRRPTHGSDDSDGGCACGPVRPARPTMTIVVDLAAATTDRFGHLLGMAAGSRPMTALSARATELLATNAELLLQVVRGRRPLLELAAHGTGEIPAAIRRAVVVRDGGCRFRCDRPIGMVHVHHIVERAAGGGHQPDNLIALCSFHHLRYVHRLGWRCALDGDTALVTWTNTRTGTSFSTLPHAARPPPTRDPALLPDWLAPPRPPPPDHLEPPDPDHGYEHRPPR